MHSNIITEVTSWDSEQVAFNIIESTVTNDRLGVIVKGSQGLWWQRPQYVDIINDAKTQGVLVGHLHYCEPDINTPQDEAAAIDAMTSNYTYPLGVWLEVGDIGKLTDYECGAWLGQLADIINTPACRVAVLTSATRHAQMANLPAYVRRVELFAPDAPTTPFWASVGGPVDDAAPDNLSFTVTSTRGVNPADDQLDRLRPPKAATVDSGAIDRAIATDQADAPTTESSPVE